MDVRFFGVAALFIPAVVIVAMRQQVVIVLVRVPVRAMFPLTHHFGRAAAMVMGEVIVIVAVFDGRMLVLRLSAFALGTLFRALHRHVVACLSNATRSVVLQTAECPHRVLPCERPACSAPASRSGAAGSRPDAHRVPAALPVPAP